MLCTVFVQDWIRRSARSGKRQNAQHFRRLQTPNSLTVQHSLLDRFELIMSSVLGFLSNIEHRLSPTSSQFSPFYFWHNARSRAENLRKLYLLIDLDANLVPLSVAANQRRAFTEILHCDWLPPKVGQD